VVCLGKSVRQSWGNLSILLEVLGVPAQSPILVDLAHENAPYGSPPDASPLQLSCPSCMCATPENSLSPATCRQIGRR
jgi:hypothetical protein